MTSSLLSPNTVELALRTFEGLGNARSLSAAIMLRYGQWDSLATLALNPKDYCDPFDFAKSAAATSFLKKCADLPTSFDRAQVARDNFWVGERSCFLANERLSPLLVENNLFQRSPEDERLADFFRRVRKNVVNWIGSRPPNTALSRGPIGRFGPGATFSDRGQLTTAAHKMSSNPTLTRDAVYHLPGWLGTQWGASCASSSRDPVFIRGNRFTTVPKDCKKDRGICVEPSLNVFFQLGLGAQLRQRLARMTGIDLDHAQDIHRQVACEASIKGHYATLDLSNASDSVSINLVKLCLPPLWYDALSDLRSPATFVDGKWVILEKFSSMGNGFTFELETIVFLALCVEVLSSDGYPANPGDDVYVFGDDIIVPTDGAQSVINMLEFCGLSLNRDKSFVDSSFRESCGGDFFNGFPVRPYHVKEQPSEPQHLISIANGLRALATRTTPQGCSQGMHRAWLYCLDLLPSEIRRCRGPSDLGDIVIHDDESRWEVTWRTPRTKTYDGIRYVRCYKPAKHRKVLYSTFHPDIVLACATYGLGWGNGGITPRDSVLGYKVGWVARS